MKISRLNNTYNYQFFKALSPKKETNIVLGQNPYYSVEPNTALNWDFEFSLNKLSKLIGKQNLYDILDGKDVNGPHSGEKNSSWFQQTKIVGINPRVCGTYWNIVKYAMTFPEDSIHLMPLFEAGAGGSLYAPSSYEVSDEFMDENLTKLGFDTPEKQLKLVVNILHALNKNVGFDFIKHVDRYSQEVFLNPENFCWVKIAQDKTKELEYPEINPDKLPQKVRSVIKKYLKDNNCAQNFNSNITRKIFDSPDNIKKVIFFSDSKDRAQRDKKRIELMTHVRSFGYETRPFAMSNPTNRVLFESYQSDEQNSWANFKTKDNTPDNIYGNITAYKLYELDNNSEFNISKINSSAWRRIKEKYGNFQEKYGFDFFRADMGMVNYGDTRNNIEAVLKKYIQSQGAKHFASFGECFYSEPCLDYKNYDAILGSAHCTNAFKMDFANKIKEYNENPNYKIAITSLTCDSDKASNKTLYAYKQGNQIRTFLGLFLNQPSYMGMGLETREKKPKTFTQDFINWNDEKFVWGKNKEFFNFLSSIRKIYTKISSTIQKQKMYWLNVKTNNKDCDKQVLSWTYIDKTTNKPSYLFALNASKIDKENIEIQNPFEVDTLANSKYNVLGLREIYSTKENEINEQDTKKSSVKKITAHIVRKGKPIKITNLASGECRIYKVQAKK